MCGEGQESHHGNKIKDIIAVDFFCGAGGVTRGLTDAGINVKAGIDIEGEFRTTYEKNNPESSFIEMDVASVTPNYIKSFFWKDENTYTLFAGCAPCQPFSNHSLKLTKQNEVRRTTLSYFGSLISKVKPDLVFSENVPGIEKKFEGAILDNFISVLEKSGYIVKNSVVDAKGYGVPQSRKRMVILASRLGRELDFPGRTHGPGLMPYVTVKDAIRRYPRIKAGVRTEPIPNHYSVGLSEQNIKRLKSTRKNGGGRKDWPSDLRLRCHEREDCGHSDVYGRMSWDRPAPTMTCRCYSISNGRFGHPSQTRAISFREAAALQTFPDSYTFYGVSNFSLGMQIGNAVPVHLAKVFGSYLVDCVSRV